MSTTARLRAYRTIVNGWVANKLTVADVDNFVKVRWITKAEGEEIKLLPRGDQQAAEQLMQRYFARES